MVTPESSSQVWTSSIDSYSGARADFAPPKVRVSSPVTTGRPDSVRPTSDERSSVVREDGRPQAERPRAVMDRAVAPRVNRRRDSMGDSFVTCFVGLCI